MSEKILVGRIIRLGRDVDTDAIIPAAYCNTGDASVLAKRLLENYDPELVNRIRPGDMIFADDNFGCGSSREHAPLAIKGAGISCLVASSFARIFYRNALNLALPVLVSPGAVAAARDGAEAKVDLETGAIEVGGQSFQAEPLPPFIQDLIAKGGLVNWVRARIDANASSS